MTVSEISRVSLFTDRKPAISAFGCSHHVSCCTSLKFFFLNIKNNILNLKLISERKRKFSTGDGEGENLKKEKHKKSSERKKVRRGGEQTRRKDVRGDSENVNQISGKHKELEKVTKSHLNQSVSHSQVSVKGSINSSECVSKSHATAEVEQSDIITSLSHKFGTTKSGDSDSESSHIVGLSHRNEGTLKSIEESDALYSGKSGYRKVTLAGKNSTSGKIICSSVEGTQSSVLSPVTNSSSGADAASQGAVREKTAAVHLEPLSRPKIILMQSDDDDDDEDFINIKADAEAGKLFTQSFSSQNVQPIYIVASLVGVYECYTAWRNKTTPE